MAFDILTYIMCKKTATTIASQAVQGKSAYEIAVDNGFVGTEAEWLESLRSGCECEEVDNDSITSQKIQELF